MLFYAIVFISLFSIFCRANPLLVNLPANSWYAAPNSKMRPVCATTAGSYGCSCVMIAWGGGAYNQDRHELVVWGGGHNDYDGNELYAFKVDSLKWARVNNPSYPVNSCNEINSDGTPVSRHTYNGLAYITHASRFFGLGGCPACAAGGCGADETWTFDFSGKKWYRMQPSGVNPTTGCGDNCAYDPANQKLYYHCQSGWFAFDFAADSWSKANTNTSSYTRTSCVDTKRHLLVEVGGGQVNTFNLNAPGLTQSQLTTTGGSAFIGVAYAGLDYDPMADKVVGYDAGKVYILDMDTRQWTINQPSGGPKNTTQNGTYGRWRYAPSENAFVLAVDVDSNVYFYKLTAGAGTSEEHGALSKAESRVQIFPNPFKSSLKICLPVEKGRVFIYDLSGRLVKTLGNAGESEVVWNTGTFAPGVYFIQAGKQRIRVTLTN